MDINVAWHTRDFLERLPFGSLGKNVLIDTSVKLIGVENIFLGDNVRIDAGTLIIATGRISIGSRVHIAANCYLEGRGGISIKSYANISNYVSIHSVSDDHSGQMMTNPMIPDAYKRLWSEEVEIGRHAIVFVKSTILPGSKIGDGAVVGAHSMAKGIIPAWTIVAGVPAIFIRERSRELLEYEKFLEDRQA
jgi:acetyltransferase-like isoleucine patch superfamily enzyme